jgi:hypothetical protein
MFVDKNEIKFLELSGNTTGLDAEDDHLSMVVPGPLTSLSQVEMLEKHSG